MVHRLSFGIILLLASLALAACRAAPTPTPTPAPVTIRVGGSDSMELLARDLADAYHQAHLNVTINFQITNSENGLRSLSLGTLDLALASRDPTAEELGPRPAQAIEIARDGIVVVVNPRNPAENLTREQVAKIFSGEFIKWSELKVKQPAEADLIQVITRESGSGTRASFEQLLMPGRRVTLAALVGPGERVVINSVGGNAGAVGYVSYLGWKNTSRARALSIDGIAPDSQTIQEGRYPLIRPLYLVVPDDSNADVSDFVDFIQSPRGRAIITNRAALPQTR